MAANLVSVTTVTGKLTGANIMTSNARIWTNPETLTASGAMNPYRPSVLKPPAASPGSTTYTGATTLPTGSSPFGVATDSNGNVYICGTYNSSSATTIYNITMNPTSSSSGYSLPATSSGWAFLIKYNSSGVYQYSTYLNTGSNYSSSYGVACDSNGNVYWSGLYINNPTIFNMTANPGTSSSGYAFPNAPGSNPPFLIKFNSSGSYVSSTIVNVGTASGNGRGVTCDSSNNVYWSGMYYNEAGFQPTIYNMAASPNSSSSGNSLPNNTAVWGAYMLKFNSSGTYQYGTVLGAGTGFQTDTYYNACDSSGNIYMTGYYISTSTLTIYNMSSTPGASSSGYTMPSSNNKGRAYTIKFNSSGTYQYSLSFGESTQDASLNNVAVDSSGNVYFAGYWRGAPTIYNMTLSPSTSSTGYSLPYQTIAYTVLLKYNSSGTYQSSTYINQSSSYGGVATDSMGNVYWGGFYQGSVAAPLYNLTANPNSTSTGYSLPNPSSNYWTFLVQYDSSGNYKTATGFFAGPYAFAQNVGIDSSGRLYSLIQATTNGGTTLYTPTANPATSSSGYTFPSTGNVGVGITLKFTFAPPVNITPLSMTLTNLGAGVTTVVEKPIYNLSGNAVTVTENSNIWTIPAASNVATAMWTIDRWLITSYTSLVPIGPELYSFTTATFTPGGATGQNGPIISQARSGLTGTPAPSAWSGTYLTMSTQGYQLWTVPATGSYTITAAGAIGAITSSGGLGGAPGSGYVITTTLSLTAGQVLKILVGQTGTSAYGAGGGGGTFIATSANSPLVCCGGGGGTTYDRGAGSNATGTGGGDTAGADGAGGSSGGCGMNGAGGASFTNNSAYAQSFINGGVGGPMPSGGCVPVSYGGFGGGAGGGNGGGGGGGYTGGAGGINNPYTGGVGGGSYCATTVTSTSLNTGVGYVTITKL